MSSSRMHDFLRSRRSIRRFRSTPIERAAVERMLGTATFAPSAHNRQPWRFVVVSSATGRSTLADAMAAAYRRDLAADGMPPERVEQLIQRSTERILSAPLLVVLCMDPTEMDRYPDAKRNEAERLMAQQSVANSGMLLLLAAHAEGLGGVWNCSPLFAPGVVSSALELPTSWEPQAMLLIGIPADIPEPRPRKEWDVISRFV